MPKLCADLREDRHHASMHERCDGGRQQANRASPLAVPLGTTTGSLCQSLDLHGRTVAFLAGRLTMAAPLLVLYGSQTGNAQARLLVPCAAHRKPVMWRQALRRVQGLMQRACRKYTATSLTLAWVPQDVAERIAREAAVRHFRPHVAAMDDYDIARLPANELVVFVASTTGQASKSPSSKNIRHLKWQGERQHCVSGSVHGMCTSCHCEHLLHSMQCPHRGGFRTL